MNTVALIYLCLSTITSEARVVGVCDLYYTLKLAGLDPFKRIYSEQFCAADKSSKLNTLYYENIDDIPRYGIFQLSGLEWCNNGRHTSANKCNTSCNNFLDDEITDDIDCVKKMITEKQNMSPWPRYLQHCDQQLLNRYYIRCLFERAS